MEGGQSVEKDCEAKYTVETHSVSSWESTDGTSHFGTCSTCSQEVTGTHDQNGKDGVTGACSVCGYKASTTYTIGITAGGIAYQHEDTTLTATVYNADGTTAVNPQPTGTWEWSVTNGTGSATVSGSSSTATLTGNTVGTVTVTAKFTPASGTAITKSTTVTVQSPFAVRSDYAKTTFSSLNDYITLSVRYKDGTAPAGTSVTWNFSDVNYLNYNSFFEYSYANANDSRTIVVRPRTTAYADSKCTVLASISYGGKTYSDSITLSMAVSTSISLTASVSDEYYFSEPSNSSLTSYSVADQLANELRRLGYYYDSTSTSWGYLDYVTFQNVTTDYGSLEGISVNSTISASNFSNIKFVPTKTGSASFRFTAYVRPYGYTGGALTPVSGLLTITVNGVTATGDVIFYGTVGQDVYMNSADFDDYWDSKFPGGILNYVTFSTSITGGSLLDGDGSVAGSKLFYVSPTRTQMNLDEVHFRPSSRTATTHSFTFTAHGENRSRQTTSVTGTVKIVYMSASPSDIKYTLGADYTVNLKASDFNAAYKEATGSNAPSNLKIVFQNVPKSGTLSYKDSSKTNSSALTLTSSNIRNRSFTTLTSGTNQIGDVTYRGSASYTDTIEYVAYSGNTPKFKGNVVFGGTTVPTDVLVTFQSSNGQPARFSWTEFTSKSPALASANKIRFTAPVNGTLYLNGAAFAASTDLLVTQVSSITYVPRAGSNAPERLAFFATNASGQSAGSGTVVINVSGNAAAVTNPNGATSASQFKDVPAGAWYFTYLDDLVRKGIVSGRDATTFDPNGTVTYGEALKLVLEAAGHSAPVGTGNEWAINYKNLAVQKGWVTSDVGLNNSISRLATAELIARVLGVSQNTGESPFADTTNGYAGALYYTNPQILMGNPNPNGGKPLFNNSTRTTLTRAEICTIIFRMNSYHLGTGTGSGNTNNNTSTTVTINPATGLPAGI